jgi:hypothetical protein
MRPAPVVAPSVAFYIQTRDVFWNGVDWENMQTRRDKKTGEYRYMPAPRLGRRAGDIYNFLLHQPATSKQLAELNGCHISTIQRSLAKMHEHGMVFKHDDGNWTVNRSREFSDVEAELHLFCKHDKQYREYVEDSKRQEKFVTDEEYRHECLRSAAKKKKMRLSTALAIRNSRKYHKKEGGN